MFKLCHTIIVIHALLARASALLLPLRKRNAAACDAAVPHEMLSASDPFFLPGKRATGCVVVLAVRRGATQLFFYALYVLCFGACKYVL